jgi:hypothetical protein
MSLRIRHKCGTKKANPADPTGRNPKMVFDVMNTGAIPPTQPIQPATTLILPRLQLWVIGLALLLLAVGAGRLLDGYGWRHAALFLVGASLGIVLYQARFGFTSAFHALMRTGNGQGLRAQMLMLALATLLFAPILAFYPASGGAVAPLSVSVLVGAFIFAVGMQLGGG